MRHASRIAACTTAAALALGPDFALAQGGSVSPSTGVTTAGLAQLCAAGGGTDTVSAAAVGYCRGFLIGVGQYHTELTARGAGRPPVFCLPEPSPTIEAAQDSFVIWSRANPQHASEKALIGLMRWAAATFPCTATQARAPSAASTGRR
jgi:hypothetical protein